MVGQGKVLRGFFQDSPLGLLKVITSTHGLCHIRFEALSDTSDERDSKDSKKIYKGIYERKPETPLEHTIFKCLNRYFKGEPETFETLPLDIQEGSDFQRAVWEALRSIPYGRIYTYAWLSEEAGYARAYRAVGQANRKNPIPIVIPCHRIINADGRLGGYQGTQGVSVKRLLLQLEGSISS